MSNITQFSQDKQVQVSERQLRRLLDFINTTEHKLTELQTLTRVITEKSENHSAIQTLSGLASTIAMDFREACGDEIEFFKQNSPLLVPTFAEELVV